METSEARTKLEDQLKIVEEKILKAEEQLQNLKDFKLKVRGGLETLDMLEEAEPEEINNNET